MVGGVVEPVGRSSMLLLGGGGPISVEEMPSALLLMSQSSPWDVCAIRMVPRPTRPCGRLVQGLCKAQATTP